MNNKFFGSNNSHLWAHLGESRQYFKDDQIVMLALTGSQNYDRM